MNKTLQDPEGRFAHFIEPIANAYGCRLTHVRLGGSQAGLSNALEVFVEREDGSPLTVEICTNISREVGAILDVEDVISGTYRLEVGSPGLDRYLSHARDFLRFVGHDIKIEFARPLPDGQKRMRGRIEAARPDGFTLLDDQNRVFELNLTDLSQARLVATDALMKLLQKGQFPPITDFTENEQALEA